ncbi:MAG TPA: polysaccharide pyruvyl transferase family protein [Opitutaceae bacterium]
MFRRILIHSGKHPYEPFDYGSSWSDAMATFGLNTGNLLFADAVFKYLHVSPEQELATDRYRFPTSDATMSPELLNEQFDCLVLPAANWLARYYRPMLPLYAEKIRRLRIPCVVIGLGAQSGGEDNFDFLREIRSEAKDFLAAVSDHCASISVRGEFTAECLRRLGFNNVNVTGCPSFYRNLQDFTVTRRPVDRGDFQLAVNGNKKLLAKMVPELFGRYPAVLFSQGDILRVALDPARAPWHDLQRAVRDGFSMRLLAEGRVRCFGDITPWIEELRRFPFSLGTRIHGSILSLLAGTPAVLITHDSRTAEMAGFYRIPTVPFRSLSRGFDPYELFVNADYAPMHAGYAARLANMAGFLEANGLDHTLHARNGSTVYDARIRQLRFASSGYAFHSPLFSVGRGLAALTAGARRVKRSLRPAVPAGDLPSTSLAA